MAFHPELVFSPTSVVLNGFTQGSVLFVGSANNVSQDNSNFFWDATNHRLGIGTASPQAQLSVGTTAATARSYNSFTDPSNGEWAYMGDWGVTANVATYGTDKNGTGTARNWQILAGGTNVLDYGISIASGFSFVSSVSGGVGTVRYQNPNSAAGTYMRHRLLTGSVNSFADIQLQDATQLQISSGSGVASGVLIITGAGSVTFSPANNTVVFPGGTLLTTATSLTNGAAAQTGTLTNAPAAGNPTKWIPINDNGTTRYIPAW